MRFLLDTHAFLWFVFSHAAKVTTLPFHHRDPFDRLLIAQSLVEDIPIISVDGKFDQYAVERLW